jgi:hypothetical protein
MDRRSSYLSVGATDAVEDDATGDVPPCVDGFADDTADDAPGSILTTIQLVSSLLDPERPDNLDDRSSPFQFSHKPISGGHPGIG